MLPCGSYSFNLYKNKSNPTQMHHGDRAVLAVTLGEELRPTEIIEWPGVIRTTMII